MRRPLTRLALDLCLGSLLLGAPAMAQDFSFAIVQGASNWTWSGTTSLGPLEGNPSTAFQLSGTFGMNLAGGGSPIGSGEITGANAAVVPDLHALIPNPIPILPPLALIDVTNLSFTYSTTPFNVAANGSFNATWTVTVLTGTLTVTPLVGSPTVTDLSGAMGTPTANPGTVNQAGAVITMISNQSTMIQFMDPGSGISATLTLDGTLHGNTTCPVPATYCQSAPNSVGPGVMIGSTGSTSWTANDLTLRATGAPAGQNGIFYFGPDQVQAPFGEGFRCVGGLVYRLGITNAGPTGTFERVLDYQNLPAGASIESGDTWNFQCWYRDPQGGPSGFNLSNGLSVKFCP